MGTLHAIASGQPSNLHREPGNPSGFKFADETTSPYLNPEQAARYLQYFVKDDAGRDTETPNVRALYQFLTRHGITKLRRGRCILVDRRELDAAIHPVKPSRAVRVAR